MDETKKSKSRRVVIIDENYPSKVTTKDTQDNRNGMDIEDTGNGTDTSDNRKVTEVALTIAEDVTDDAVHSMEETKHCTRKIRWVTHGEFTAEKGRRQIQELISKCEAFQMETSFKLIVDFSESLTHQSMTCKYCIGWAYSTEFLKKEDVIHSFHYIYRVSWSLSTAQLPMPSVYAIAYFTIKIRKNKPREAPIDISYVFEDQTLVRRPELICFEEGVLMNIIEAKYVLINAVKAYLKSA